MKCIITKLTKSRPTQRSFINSYLHGCID